MTVDTSKIHYSSQFNAYKNLGVHLGSIFVDTAAIAPGTLKNWQTTITVEPDSRFALALIEANGDNFPVGVTPLRFQAFPPANAVWQTLSVDPGGVVTHNMNIDMIVNNNQVTFRLEAFNPYGSNLAFNSLTVNFVYVTHTTAR